MPDMWMDVDTALSEVPVNKFPLVDDTDYKTWETTVAYNADGMTLLWNFVTTGGAFTQTAVTPTTGGAYDWAHAGNAMFTIEIPASGGASINNDTEGVGWFSGKATGVYPWIGPFIGFRAAAINDALIDLAQSHADGLPIKSDLADAEGLTDQMKTAMAAAPEDFPVKVNEFADNALTAAALATDAVTEIVNAIKAGVSEGSLELDDLIRLIAAATLGDTEDDGLSFRDLGDTKDRFTVTIDGSNRTITVVDAT